jgi:ribosomal protein S18 acetylase RimI-like enzyme
MGTEISRIMAPMRPTVFFRTMTEDDLEDARRLWSEADGVELAEGDGVEDLRRYLRRNPGMSYVALADSRVVGAILAGHDGRRGLLYHLAVVKDCRSMGIGRQLVARSASALRQAGISRVLILVARNNEAGREFWLKQGWESLTFAEPMGRDL